MHIQTDRALIPAHVPSVRHLHVTITAPPAKAPAGAPRPPARVALVLDRSGSMGGTKMAMARNAVQHAIRLLKAQDRLAVVCYDDRVETILANTAASPEAKTLALQRLAQVDARGSTNLEGGWLRGAEELGPNAGMPLLDGLGPDSPARGVSRVLLLTDGLANQGETNPQALAATAARLRAEGIATSTFGVGADFDEVLLQRLAADGGGHFYFIEQPQQIPDLLASELGETLEVVARDAVFEIAAAPDVDLGVLNDLPTDSAPGRLRVRLGDLIADQEITLVLAVGVRQPPALGEHVEVQCRVADRDHVFFPQPMAVQWQVVDGAANDAQPVNQAVVVAVARLLAEGAKSKALDANRRGDFAEARRILEDMAKTLEAMAMGNPEIGALAAGLRAEIHLFEDAMSPVDAKRRHFASYEVANSRAEGGKARRRANRLVRRNPRPCSSFSKWIHLFSQ